jgi:dipeptidase D
LKVTLKGLRGGHSGLEINEGRANANKLLVRFLCDEMQKMDLRLVDIHSGGLHNAIPREGWAMCAVPMAMKEQVRIDLNIYAAALSEEYSVTEPELQCLLESQPAADTCLEVEGTKRMLLSLRAVHNGIYAMSQDMEGLVETSSNLASIHHTDGQVVVATSQRSSIGSARENMSQVVAAALQLGGAKTDIGEGYPGWKMNPNSVILKVATDSYRRLFGKEPLILAIHAGLECGLFSEKYPGLDMISVGPTLRGVHSPEERLHIPSVDLVWQHLLDILKHIPA